MEFQRFSSENERKYFADVAKLISYAIRQSPADLMQRVVESNMTSTSAAFQDIADSVAGVIHESFIEHTGDHSAAGVSFLGPAINDTARIVKVIVEQYPNVSDEMITQTMAHHETIRTIALLALRPESDMSIYVRYTLQNTGRLSDEGAYTVEDKSNLLHEEFEGCPAAGFKANYNQTSKVAPLPIFKQIIPWAAEIYLLSQEWQERRASLYDAHAR